MYNYGIKKLESYQDFQQVFYMALSLEESYKAILLIFYYYPSWLILDSIDELIKQGEESFLAFIQLVFVSILCILMYPL